MGTNDANGQAGRYDGNGRSLKRQFLRSPLRFDPRMTSRFSSRRLHPVHGMYRAHLGVDYGAPYGTPVMTVAMASSSSPGIRAKQAAWFAFGTRADTRRRTCICLRSVRIRPGVRVAQSQFIGRVGATGAATGPHLDYRIIKNGRYVDPIAEHKRMPKGETIRADGAAGIPDTAR